MNIAPIQKNSFYSVRQAANVAFSTVLETEYHEGRLEHEELVYLTNGITLEVKWGGPFRKEGSYRKGESIGVVREDGYLTIFRYEGDNIIHQERFVLVKNNYYISDQTFFL